MAKDNNFARVLKTTLPPTITRNACDIHTAALCSLPRSKLSLTPETNLRTLNLILGDCEVTDAGCQVMADIVKVNDTIEELDLPKNTKSSKKYKITIDESAEEVERRSDVP